MLTKMKTKANAIQSDIYKMALLSSKIEDIDGGTCHMIKRVGRKSKLTEEEVRKVILMFRENVQAMGNISFSEIHRYANELHEQGVISASTSDAFWRKEGRLGRIEVEKANEVLVKP